MTYQVFVAEDEARVREGIRNQLTGRYQLCGEAADGEMALPAVLELKPDILITDIRMPFMDGLTLAKAVKRAIPRTKVLIVSGHDEFEYAQQAISIGVDEYLLKPFDSKSLLAALGKAAGQLEEERAGMGREPRHRQRQEELALRDSFLDEVLSGALDAARVLEGAERHGLNLPARCYLVAEMELSYDKATRGDSLGVSALADAMLSHREDILWCMRGWDRVVLIAKGDSKEQLDATLYEALPALRDELARVLGISCLCAVGTPAGRIAEIASSYRDAHSLIRRFPGLPAGAILSAEDVEKGSLLDLAAGDQPIARQLYHATSRDIPQLLAQVCDSKGDVGSLLYVYYRITDLIVTATRIVRESGGDPSRVFPGLGDAGSLLRTSDPGEIRRLAQEVLERFVAYKESTPGSLRYGDVISRAKSYIWENFHDSGISLNTVAAYTGFSPNHFSTIFSQNTGETFIGFLTRVRMEQAKKLLQTTSLSSAQVAFRTGYNDSNYFRYLFKKHYGISPREARSQEPGD